MKNMIKNSKLSLPHENFQFATLVLQFIFTDSSNTFRKTN